MSKHFAFMLAIIAVNAMPKLFNGITFNLHLEFFPSGFNFNEVYEMPDGITQTRTGRFLYHVSLFVNPMIIAYWFKVTLPLNVDTYLVKCIMSFTIYVGFLMIANIIYCNAMCEYQSWIYWAELLAVIIAYLEYRDYKKKLNEGPRYNVTSTSGR